MKGKSMNSITGASPTATLIPTAVKPAQVTAAPTDNGNTITANVYNAVQLNQSNISNLLVANELDVTVSGDNNNVTINEYNNITVGGAGDSTSPSILPSQNADGTINLDGSAQDAVTTYIEQELMALITGSDAYKKAQSNTQPATTPTTRVTA